MVSVSAPAARRRPPPAGRRGGQVEGLAREAERVTVSLLPPRAGGHLWVLGQALGVEHRGHGDAQGLGELDDLLDGAVLGPLPEGLEDPGNVGVPLDQVVGQPFLAQVGALDHHKQVGIGDDPHGVKPAVGRPDEVHRQPGQQHPIARPRGHQPGVSGQHRLQVAHLDPLAQPATPPLVYASQGGKGGVGAGVQLGLTARQVDRLPIRRAREIEVAPHGPDGDVAAPPVRIRSGPAPRREIDLHDMLGPRRELRLPPRRPVHEHHVSRPDQPLQHPRGITAGRDHRFLAA